MFLRGIPGFILFLFIPGRVGWGLLPGKGKSIIRMDLWWCWPFPDVLGEIIRLLLLDVGLERILVPRDALVAAGGDRFCFCGDLPVAGPRPFPPKTRLPPLPLPIPYPQHHPPPLPPLPPLPHRNAQIRPQARLRRRVSRAPSTRRKSPLTPIVVSNPMAR